MPAVAFLGLAIATATIISFGRMGAIDGVALGSSIATGMVAAVLWWSGRFLPQGLAPSAGAAGLIASFVPAAFIPEAFFIGAGLLFMFFCAMAGGLFSFIFGMFFDRSSNSAVNADADEPPRPLP